MRSEALIRPRTSKNGTTDHQDKRRIALGIFSTLRSSERNA